MYEITYNILNYDRYKHMLEEIETNPKNKYNVKKQKPIGKSECGFFLEHYTIGEGYIHVVYFAGVHGNEIIGVDFLLQLMKNIALGCGVFNAFDPATFTIDFIPLVNPEGFFITTYALQSVLQNKTQEEQRRFCKTYYLQYRQENVKIEAVNQVLKNYFLENYEEKKNAFWNHYNKQNIKEKDVRNFLESYLGKIKEDIHVPTITKDKEYLQPFVDVNENCIPLKDGAHKNLRESIRKLYQKNTFPLYTMANFLANASGINLNANNPFCFEKIKKEKDSIRFASPIYPILKSDVSPYGTCSIQKEYFTYTKENASLLSFFDALGSSCYLSINCHGTGGQIYIQPFEEKIKKVRDFSFYINNRLGTEYSKEIARTYLEKTGHKETYTIMEHPKEIVGTGDMLRAKYIAHFLLELSKAGGNPLGPYIEPNYTLTMEANFRACKKVLDTILEVRELYDKKYEIDNRNGWSINGEARKRIRKKNTCE